MIGTPCDPFPTIFNGPDSLAGGGGHDRDYADFTPGGAQ
jgi:hypothetical protein